jgi:tetratricopeptide (TPR) repeat protein
LVEEEHLVIEKLRNLAEYHILYSKINYIFRIGGFVKSPEEREMVEEISNHALISGKNTALSNRAASICYYIKGFCSAANRNTEESFEFFSKAKYILDQNPQLRKDLGKRYVRTIANLIQVEIRSKRFDEATRLIGEVEALKGTTGFNSTDLEVILYYTSSLAKLLLFIRQGKFEDSLVLMEAITTNFEKYGSKINKEQEVVFNYVFAYCYFGAQQYNKALSCINKILNDNENTLRQDVYAYARIFNLVIHYELNNVDLLYYIIKSTQRYLGKQDQSFMVEKLLVDFFKKAIKPLKDEKESELFEEFYTELKKLFTDDSQRVILEYFDFNSWIKSKITKTSFQELITEKGSAT